MVTTVSIFILISFVRLLYCSQSPSNTHKPSYLPTSTPSSVPSSRPTASPSVSFDPTPCPSSQPTGLPTGQPSAAPSRRPTSQPTRQPTSQPTSRPSHPTKQPTPKPSYKPSTKPSCIPTTKPTAKPTYTKTNAPSSKPTTYHAPTPLPSELPTGQPSARPSSQPTAHPSPHPTKPTYLPTKHPLSYQPSSKPTPRPSSSPDNNLPTFIPTSKPSVIPTSKPSSKPTVSPSAKPTKTPISSPTSNPIISSYPTGQPTGVPTFFPSGQPTTRPTVGPTKSKPPTSNPTSIPSKQPTSQPTGIPSNQPTSQPTSKPSIPTGQPTSQPSRQPTRQPTSQPTSQPTTKPTSGYHTPKPSTLNPTALPTFTVPPTSQPTGQPSKEPTGQPSSRPTSYPSVSFPPTYLPSSSPTGQPTSIPTTIWGSTSAPTYAYLLYNVTGSVSFDSTNTCEDLEITLQFTFHRNISSGTIILIETPGLTSGSCYNPIDGSHISDVVVFNSSLFTLSYYEGSYSTLYNTSYLKINITHPVLLSIGYKYSLIIDRINGLKRACTTNTTWIVKYYRSNRLTPVSVGHLLLYESASLRCYFFNTSLSFSPAFPQFPTGINITLFPAFLLDSSMSFDIYLPGFSNQIENYPLDNLGYNYTTVEEVVRYISSNSTLLELSYNTNYSWFGTFHGFNSSGYNSSFIRISPRGSQEYITSLWIYIPAYPNRLIPLCGHPANYSGYTIKTDSPIGNIYVNDTVISYSSASGPGCSKLNNCNGNGNCNFCDMKCECYSGFGSLSDLSIAISNDFNPDCSSRLCPIGPAFAAIPSYSTDTRLASVHRSTECSNNGICDRSIGKCKCFKGFVGNSCEKRNCPSIDGKLCSGRGQCLSMRLLAYESTALPLQRNSSNIFYTGIISPNAWDKDSSYQCLCDSSWKVGLGSNQTQLAEFFGPACELRRCPSGNDPETDEDETDCANKSQTGGDVGQEGNKCQIDCSNRGVCDYNTGTCTCFTGYQGINCGTIQRYAGHIYRDEIIYSNRQPTSLGEGTLASYLTDSIDPSETLSEYESS